MSIYYIDYAILQKKVCFSAMKTTGSARGGITYNYCPINKGNGMNPGTGKFTAPCGGIYSFTFTAVVLDATISFKKNGADQFALLESHKTCNVNPDKTISGSWMCQLNAGDVVNLEQGGSCTPINIYYNWYTHFTGMLID